VILFNFNTRKQLKPTKGRKEGRKEDDENEEKRRHKSSFG
jgi:hypothetical protein